MNLLGIEVSASTSRRLSLKRPAASLLTSALLVAGLAACGASSTAPASQPESGSAQSAAAKLVPESLKGKALSVAVLNNYPPGGFLEGDKLTGYGPDLVRAIAADTGLQINLQPSSFDAIIPGLQSKRWDFGAPPFSLTDERLKVLDLVPIHSSGTVYVVEANSGLNIEKGLDLCGHTVGGVQGITEMKYAAELSTQCEQAGKPAITQKEFGSQNEAVLALSSSRVDIVTTGAATASYLVSNSNEKFNLTPFTYKATTQSIGFIKGSEMGPIISQAMKDLAQNGEYKKILDKYGMAHLAVSDFEVRK